MPEPEPRFDTADVRDILARTSGNPENVIGAFVSIRLVSNSELAVELTSKDRSVRKRVTESFYVKIFRGDVPDHETAKKLHL